MAAAFALKDSFADKDFHGGVLARYDGTSFNVGEELEKGDGVIVVDNPHDEALLREYDALKSVAMPKSESSGDEEEEAEAESEASEPDGLEKLYKDDLISLAESNDVEFEDSDTKRDLISKLREAGVSAEGGSE